MRSEEGLILLTENGTPLWANRVAADLLGYSQSEFYQLALPMLDGDEGDLFRPIGFVATAFRSLLTGEATEAEGEACFPSKDNKRVAVHWKLWSLPSAPARKQVLLSISETAQASTKGPILSGYRDIFEHAVEGIFRSTIEGQYIEVNPALAQIYGYRSPAELVAALRDLKTE